MYTRQSERQNGGRDGIDFFRGSKRQDSRNQELRGFRLWDGHLTLGLIRNVFAPVRKLESETIVPRGKRQHPFVGEVLVFDVPVAIFIKDVVQIFLSDENQFIGV